MKLTPGSRWKSAVCGAEAVVVRTPKEEGALCCGGATMTPHAESGSGGVLDKAHSAGCLLGKRYGDDTAGLELLCTKAGQGSFSFAGRALVLREAKKLPSSD